MKITFAKNMAKRRIELGWTQEQAARAIGAGVSRSNIGAWEEGRSYPYLDKLISIKRAYKIKDLNKFLFGDDLDQLNQLSSREIEIVSKYYALNEKEKKAVDVILEINQTVV